MLIYNLTIDDISPWITYEGLWKDSSDDIQYVHYLNQTFRATQTAGANASFSFNGTGVYLYGAKRGNHGTFSVSIDEQVMPGLNGDGEDQYQVLLYGKPDLPYGLHRVVLTNTAAPLWLDLDFVTITTGDERSDTYAHDIAIDDTAFIYDKLWTDRPNSLDPDYANSTEHRSNLLHATAQIPFLGNAIKLYSATSDNHGLFSVSLDGAPAVILNGSAPLGTFRPNTLLYQFDGLSSGNHTLTVQNVQDGKYVDLDQAIVSTYSTTKPLDVSSSSSMFSKLPSPTAFATHGRRPPSAAVITGAVLGVAVFLLLIFIGFLTYRYRKSRKELMPESYAVPFDPSPTFTRPAAGNLPHVQISESFLGSEHPGLCPPPSYAELAVNSHTYRINKTLLRPLPTLPLRPGRTEGMRSSQSGSAFLLG